MKKRTVNYARNLNTNQLVFFREGDKVSLPHHVSQYAFFRVPSGHDYNSFLGALIHEDEVAYGHRVHAAARHALNVSPHQAPTRMLRSLVRDRFYGAAGMS